MGFSYICWWSYLFRFKKKNHKKLVKKEAIYKASKHGRKAQINAETPNSRNEKTEIEQFTWNMNSKIYTKLLKVNLKMIKN